MYGGTKSEMERLLKDAEKLTGEKYDISNFADIIKAIKAIQDEMGITGTTAKEASETIQGSALAMKAAWANFLTGLADDDADFDQLFDNLIDSVNTFLKNIIPRIKKMLPRLVKGLTQIAKTIGKELPGILNDLLPALIEGGVDLVGSLFGVLRDNAPMFKEIGLNIIKSLYEGITGKKMSTETFDKLKAKVDKVCGAIKNIIAAVVKFGKQLWTVVGPALGWILDMAINAFGWIGDNINWILPILGALLGAMLAFKAVRKVSGAVKGFMGLFGKGGGAVGAAGGNAAGGLMGGGLFSMKPTQVLKGLANIGIIVVGLGALAALVMWAAPKLAKLTDTKSLIKLGATIVAIGVVGSLMAQMAGWVGNIPVAKVAKGLANIAIVVVGLGALAFVLGWASSKFTFKVDDMIKLAAVIGAVGLIGAALAGLAGLIGHIPVVAVAKGLLGIAIALGGFTLIIAAFAALSKIKGFNEFITTGGATLTQICGIIGEMAGSIIGGFGEGLTASLPNIGQNLADFATNIQPMLTAFSGVDTSGIGVFAEGLGKLLLALTADSVFSFFTGGVDYAGLATDLNTFASGLGGFFTTVSGIDESAYTKASGLFECLAGLESLPKEGGVVGWFQGEVDFQKIATGMQQLGSSGMIIALKAIQNIPEEAFTSMGKLFDALSGIKSLPKEGGVVGWFTGEVDFTKMATGIQQLGSSGMILALKAIQGIPEEGFTGLGKLFEALAGIKTLPKEGGVVGWFQGEVDFSKMAVGIQQLSNSAMVIALKAIQNIPEAAFTNLTALFNALAGINGLPTSGGIFQWFTGTVDFSQIATGLQTLTTAETIAALDKVKSIPTEALTSLTALFNALAGIDSLPKDGGVAGFFTGEVDFSKIAAGLQSFGSAETIAALNAIKDVPTTAFDGLTGLFNALAGIKSLPKEGGVAGFFTGEVDFSKIAAGLQSFGSAETVAALNAIKDVPTEAFTSLTSLFSALADIKSLPKEGGVAGFFTGEVDFSKISAGLQAFGSAETVAALNAIKDLPTTAFSNLSALFNSLADIKDLPKEGGVFGWFSGSSTEGLTNLTSQLATVGSNIATFFTNLGGITDFTLISDLFTTLSGIEIDSDAASKGFLGLGTSDLQAMGTGLSSFATNAADFFTAVSSYSATTISEFFTAIGEGGALPEKLTGLDGTIGTTLSTMATNISTNMETIKTTLDTGLNACIATIKLKQTGFFNSGVHIMEGLKGGILSMEATVMAAVQRIANNIKTTFDNAQQINSPSKVMFKSATWSGMGIVEGLRSTLPEIEGATRTISDAMIPYGATYTPESGGSGYYHGGNSEVTNVSPVFNLTISGTQDDRSLARRVKQYVAEAIEETFESLERKSYAIREV